MSDTYENFAEFEAGHNAWLKELDEKISTASALKNESESDVTEACHAMVWFHDMGLAVLKTEKLKLADLLKKGRICKGMKEAVDGSKRFTKSLEKTTKAVKTLVTDAKDPVTARRKVFVLLAKLLEFAGVVRAMHLIEYDTLKAKFDAGEIS